MRSDIAVVRYEAMESLMRSCTVQGGFPVAAVVEIENDDGIGYGLSSVYAMTDERLADILRLMVVELDRRIRGRK